MLEVRHCDSVIWRLHADLNVSDLKSAVTRCRVCGISSHNLLQLVLLLVHIKQALEVQPQFRPQDILTTVVLFVLWQVVYSNGEFVQANFIDVESAAVLVASNLHYIHEDQKRDEDSQINVDEVLGELLALHFIVNKWQVDHV